MASSTLVDREKRDIIMNVGRWLLEHGFRLATDDGREDVYHFDPGSCTLGIIWEDPSLRPKGARELIHLLFFDKRKLVGQKGGEFLHQLFNRLLLIFDDKRKLVHLGTLNLCDQGPRPKWVLVTYGRAYEPFTRKNICDRIASEFNVEVVSVLADEKERIVQR